MREIVISGIAIILAASCIIFFSCMAKKSENTQELVTKIELEVSEFRREKKKLEIELADLEKNHRRETVGMSRLVFCIREADDTFVESILPVLKEKKIPAVMCISKDTMPGDTSLLSMEAYSTLIEEGWQSAVILSSNKSISDWYDEVKLLFENSGIEVPSVVLVNEADFSTPLAHELYSYGFSDIIIKAAKPDILRMDIVEGARLTDAIGWYTYGAADIIDLFADNVGDAVFMIGGSEADEIYVEDQFTSMLNTINQAVEKEQLFFTTPEKIGEYMNKLTEAYNNSIDEYNAKRNNLKEEIKRLDGVIESIYDEYLDEE